MKQKLFLVLVIGLILGLFTYPSYAATDITISTSQDIKASNGATATFTGYLVDQICAQKGGGFDGTDLIHHPEAHTLRCLKMSMCIEPSFLNGDFFG